MGGLCCKRPGGQTVFRSEALAVVGEEGGAIKSQPWVDWHIIQGSDRTGSGNNVNIRGC